MNFSEQDEPLPELSHAELVQPEIVTGTDDPPSSPNWLGKLSLSGMLAWLVILAATLFLCYRASAGMFEVATETGGNATSMELYPVQMQGKIIVGQKRLLGAAAKDGSNLEAIEQGIEALDTGPYEQRLGVAILKNEVRGATAAIDYLEKLDEKVVEHELVLTGEQVRLREILGTLFGDYEAGETEADSVSDDDQSFLKNHLRWLGELALLPPETEQKNDRQKLVSGSSTLIILLFFFFILGLLVLVAGFVVAIILFVFACQGKLTSGFHASFTNHNIYAETFAIWMIGFFGGSVAISLIIPNEMTLMYLQPVLFFGSLLCLFWPVLRGIPFDQVRQDIGWKCGRTGVDAATSILSYISTLPLLVPALLLVVLLMFLVGSVQEPLEFSRQVAPSHPVQEFVSQGNWQMLLMVFIAVCVCAPVVEETMFRGVLYRHLRDLSGNWGRWVSVPLSAILNGIIFAACHPQGVLAIPLLATLAVGFSLAREWRGSLASPMIMHAIHNGLLTCFMLLIL